VVRPDKLTVQGKLVYINLPVGRIIIGPLSQDIVWQRGCLDKFDCRSLSVPLSVPRSNIEVLTLRQDTYCTNLRFRVILL